MRSILSLLTFAILLLSLGCSSSRSLKPLPVGAQSPNPKIYLLDGPIRAVSHWKDKVLVLSFWDVTCSRCKQKLPLVNDLARSLADHEGVVFIASSINGHEDEIRVRNAIADLSIDSMIHAFSGNGVSDEAYLAFRGTEVPYYIVIDPAGRLRFTGDDLDELKSSIILSMRPS